MSPLFATLLMGAGGYALAKLRAKPPGQAQRIYIPTVPDSPARPGQAPVMPVGPRHLSTLQPYPGRFYRAVINVNGPLSWVASASKVQSRAQSEGFANVSVSKTKPGDWPGSITGDYYVTGIYQGAPKVFERSYGGGAVTIPDGWEG